MEFFYGFLAGFAGSTLLGCLLIKRALTPRAHGTQDWSDPSTREPAFGRATSQASGVHPDS